MYEATMYNTYSVVMGVGGGELSVVGSRDLKGLRFLILDTAPTFSEKIWFSILVPDHCDGDPSLRSPGFGGMV